MVSSSKGSSPKSADVEVRGVEETDWDTTYAIEGSVSDCARDEGPGRIAMLISVSSRVIKVRYFGTCVPPYPSRLPQVS